ncbi:MAG: hypothetical protein LUQ65_06340 [Candidatus Helarchaeota archaeon]|nr:hypothetical protein [Candidatus Helarchaeota archaeon]
MVYIKKAMMKTFWRKIYVAIAVVIILISILMTFGVQLLITLDNYYISYFKSSDRLPNTPFVPLNATLLDLAEQRYEALLDFYHRPFNLTGNNLSLPLCDVLTRLYNNTIFNNTADYLAVADPLDFSSPYNQLERYEGLEHTVGTNGLYLMGQAFKYAVAIREGNESLKQQALARIQYEVDAISLFTDLTGDGSLPRWASPNTTQARSLFAQRLFTTQYSGSHPVFPVYYNKTNCWWYLETGTSKDLYLGVLTGFAFAYLFCEEEELRSKIRTVVDRILNYFQQTGWKVVDVDGKMNDLGSDLPNGAPFADPIYVLAFLQVGRLVHWDLWNDIYNLYLYDRGYIQDIGLHEQLGVYDILMLTDNYFDLLLQNHVLFLAAFFEPDPAVRAIYLNAFARMNQIWRYHRNVFFDLMYLAVSIPKVGGEVIHSSNFTSYNNIKRSSEELSYYRTDVIDGLMRYAVTKYPKRTFQNPILDYKINPNFRPIFGNYSYYPNIALYNPSGGDFFLNLVKEIGGEQVKVNVSLPVDMRGWGTFLWESSCFELERGGNGRFQVMPLDYLTPYWMAHYMYMF